MTITFEYEKTMTTRITITRMTKSWALKNQTTRVLQCCRKKMYVNKYIYYSMMTSLCTRQHACPPYAQIYWTCLGTRQLFLYGKDERVAANLTNHSFIAVDLFSRLQLALTTLVCAKGVSNRPGLLYIQHGQMGRSH